VITRRLVPWAGTGLTVEALVPCSH